MAELNIVLFIIHNILGGYARYATPNFEHVVCVNGTLALDNILPMFIYIYIFGGVEALSLRFGRNN